MSYILDALKKSESERHRGSAPEFSTTQMLVTHKSKAMPRWVLVLVSLLVVNLLVIAGLYLKSDNFTAKNDIAPVSIKLNEVTSTAPVTLGNRLLTGEDQSTNGLQVKPEIAYKPALDETPIVAPVPIESTRQPEEVIRVDPRPLKATQKSAPVITAPSFSQAPILAKPIVEPMNPATVDAEYTTDDQSDSDSANFSENAEIEYLNDMDRAFQESIPSLVFNSHIYASDPSRRRIMINDLYLKTGQKVSGLIIEDITEDGVVLSKNGRHFKLSVIRNWSFAK